MDTVTIRIADPSTTKATAEFIFSEIYAVMEMNLNDMAKGTARIFDAYPLPYHLLYNIDQLSHPRYKFLGFGSNISQNTANFTCDESLMDNTEFKACIAYPLTKENMDIYINFESFFKVKVLWLFYGLR